ncbi:MAG: 50S ribosomal protein L34e [Candidatus Aenigmatarchaeota archaeon]
MRNSNSIRKIKRKAPGGHTIVRLKKKKPSYAKCKECGKKLNRAKLSIKKLKNLPKTKKRSERPFPELCSRCMRKHFKEKVR